MLKLSDYEYRYNHKSQIYSFYGKYYTRLQNPEQYVQISTRHECGLMFIS